MNDAELNEVVAEWAKAVGAPVTGAWQPARDRFVVGIGSRYLLIVPRGPFARVHEVRARPTNPLRPFSFQGAARAHLAQPLTGVTKHASDRIVDLHFGSVTLHIRLTGRSGGLWLVAADQVIAAYDGPAPASLPDIAPSPGRKAVTRFTPTADQSWNDAAARWFHAAERAHADRERRRRLAVDLGREIARLERLLEALHADLENASTAPRLRRMADALAARLHTISRGSTTATVPDLEDPEILHAVTLDPGQPAAATMERLYAKARRLDRAGDRILENLDATEQRIRDARAALDAVDTAEEGALVAFERMVPRTSSRRPDAVDGPWWTWTGPEGQMVWVGRNEKGNRKLTFQKARGDDYWLHVRGRPGAHVVLAAQGKSPPLDLLLAAAQIALVHAKVQDGISMDVQYTRVRNIRPIPGEVARVQVMDERVLHVQRDPAQLRGWGREGDGG